MKLRCTTKGRILTDGLVTETMPGSMRKFTNVALYQKSPAVGSSQQASKSLALPPQHHLRFQHVARLQASVELAIFKTIGQLASREICLSYGNTDC